MVNLVRVSPSAGLDDDAALQAARAQVAMALQQEQQAGPTQLPLAQGGNQVQARYGIGNALADLANKFSAVYAANKANQRYQSLQDQKNAAITDANRQKLDALVPPTLPGGSTPAPVTLDAVPSPQQSFSAPDLSQGAPAAPTPATLPATQDQPVTLNESHLTPPTVNPARAQIASLLAGQSPAAVSNLLTNVLARNAFPDPAVVEAQKDREAQIAATEADRQAARAQQLGIANQTDATRREIAAEGNQTRQALAAATAGDKAQKAQDASDAMDARVEMARRYDAPPPAGMGSNTPAANMFWAKMKALDDADPTGTKYDATKYATYQRGRNAFTSGTQGNMVRSLNVAVQHMNTLEPMIDALHNGDYKLFNALGNAAGIQMGNTPVTNFRTGADILGVEVEKALVQNGGTGPEREESKAKFDAAQAPQQLHEGLGIARKFLGGQLRGLIKQGTAATGWDEDTFKKNLLLPDSLTATGMAGGHQTSGGASVSNW